MSTITWLAKSCFSVWWLPLDDRELSLTSHGTMKNMAFDKKNEKSFNRINNNNLSRPNTKKGHSKRHLNDPIIKDKDGGVTIGNKFDHYSSWSLSGDEDYIVFCFGKDVAQGDKGVGEVHKNSRPLNRKLNYGENEEQEVKLCHVEGNEGSAETSNSNQSEGRRSSFAFPVLGWEWIGSPVQMPKSEGLQPRKNKARAMRFQCCKF